MKKMGKGISIILTGCSTTTTTQNKVPELNDEQKKYIEKIDTNYSYEIAKRMEEYKTNETLGYKTAGSEAEIKTGQMLYDEMQSIGLTNVSKDEIKLDTWTFEKAKMSYTDDSGKNYKFDLGGYQTNFNTSGEKEFEVVYAKRGTASDLENIDVNNKLVLIDINQEDEWWINYPTYQAHVKGAAGVIAVQNGGYSEVDPTALNTQNICGPTDAPAFSMSQTDAKVLKEAIKNNSDKAIKVKFDAESEVGLDGKTYNIVGTILGKDPEGMVLMSAHMDSYYTGFQDDNAAVGMMMGIAKAIVDSGYKPEKTLIFCALAAEEWGVSNTRYDWLTGAYNQIFRAHPEWVGKVVADINFELPAYEHESKDYLRSSYEYSTFLNEFIEKVPKVDGACREGIEVISPIQTWSDDFSFSIAGVPSMRNDFSGNFMEQRYHSQFDNDSTYNEKAFLQHHQLYGTLMLEYDRNAVAPLNFITRMEALEKSIDNNIMGKYNIDTNKLLEEIKETKESAKTIYAKVEQINAEYQKALEEGKDEEAKKIYEESRDLNSDLLKVFKFAEDKFVRLTWEDENIFPHEKAQSNIDNINKSIEALEKKDVKTVIDEYLYAVDNNWYAYDFDEEVFNYFTNYVLDQPVDRLMWGAGRVEGHENLFSTVKSLLDKYEEKNPDLSKEIDRLKTAENNQKEMLNKHINEEVESVKTLNKMLKDIN